MNRTMKFLPPHTKIAGVGKYEGESGEAYSFQIEILERGE